MKQNTTEECAFYRLILYLHALITQLVAETGTVYSSGTQADFQPLPYFPQPDTIKWPVSTCSSLDLLN